MESRLECCRLCLTDVITGTAKATRVKLYGDSAAGVETREKLDCFLDRELYISLSHTKARTRTGDSFICHKCHTEIDRYFKLIQEINLKREQLVLKCKENLLEVCSSAASILGKRKVSELPVTATSSSHDRHACRLN